MSEQIYTKHIKSEDCPLALPGRPVLKRLDFELTERCNNNCIHCNINLPEKDRKAKELELSTREIQKIIREAHDLGCSKVRFTGGEPLLRKDFEEIFIFSRKLGMEVILFTNATLITPQLAALFKEIPPGDLIEVSLYGMKKTSYEAVSRVPGSFEAAWRGIDLLRENQIPFVVKSALLPPNKSELKEFLAWAETIPWMSGRPQITMLYNLRTRRDSTVLNQAITRFRPDPEEVLKYFTMFPEEYRQTMKQLLSRHPKPPGGKLFSCGAGGSISSVDAYGYWQPCIQVRDPAITRQLKNSALKEALVDFALNHKDRKAKNPEYLNRCGVCFLNGSVCEQCPGKSWIEYGTLEKPVEYLCQVAHAQARYLGLLRKDELSWEIGDGQERILEFLGK